MQGKRVQDSCVTISYVMMPEDANPAGNVHGGIIMKHIDMTGGVAAMRHARCNVVTASIDSLIFHYPVFIGDLVTLKASLNMVARSSMEVGVRIETENLFTGEVRHTASAYLTFVALDRNGRPTPVQPLILETEDDKRRNRQAMERREVRLKEKNKKAAESRK
jgi:acyl-CoA hydrolase